jgi:hypothetical protein
LNIALTARGWEQWEDYQGRVERDAVAVTEGESKAGEGGLGICPHPIFRWNKIGGGGEKGTKSTKY